jgi:hypothetical protein
MSFKLYPNIVQLFVIFQFLYIWFKGEPYFSWWLIIPFIFIWILIDTLAGKMEKFVDKNYRLLPKKDFDNYKKTVEEKIK